MEHDMADDLERQARILLVDDSMMDMELALEAFSGLGFATTVDVALGGREALDRLLGVTMQEDGTPFATPDIILLDLKMPGVDGFEVLRQVKGNPALRQIPVIILTSSREEGDRAMSYDTGANSYLVKPLSFDGFIDVIHQIGDYWLILNVRPPGMPARCRPETDAGVRQPHAGSPA